MNIPGYKSSDEFQLMILFMQAYIVNGRMSSLRCPAFEDGFANKKLSSHPFKVYLNKTDPLSHIKQILIANGDTLEYNWDKFLNLCRMHKVESFVYQVITGENSESLFSISALIQRNNSLGYKNPGNINIPENVFNILQNNALNNARAATKLYSENLRLTKLLKKNNIQFTILKGPLFSEKYYGNLAIRHAGDIDLLISPKDLDRAVEILKNNGYTYKTKIPFSKQIKYKHHISLSNQKHGILLELHWRPFIYNYLFEIKLEEKNCASTNLSFEEYFIYLCTHGSKHNWFRIFWLFDIAVIIQKQKINWKKLLKKTKEYDLIRPVCEAVILSNIFFDTKTPDIINKSEIKNRRSEAGGQRSEIYYIVNNSIKCIVEGSDITESGMLLKKFSLFILRLKHNLRLKCSLKHKLDTLKVHLTHSRDWEILPLPTPLFPLYFILRPILFLIRNIKK